VGDISARNFGLLIAYLIPGFITLWGLSFSSESVRTWLVGGAAGGPSVGSALYVLIASVACGMTASAFRWALIDSLHHRTGLTKPVLNEARLAETLEAFDYLVEHHYRYYQFYGNTLVATVVAYAAWRHSAAAAGVGVGTLEAGLLLVILVFAFGSRDALSKYYAGGSLLLGTVRKECSHDERQAPAQGPRTSSDDIVPDGSGQHDGEGGHGP
jgi:hypothetical protein